MISSVDRMSSPRRVACGSTGMQSVRRTVPVVVANVVTGTFVSGKYARRQVCGARGPIRNPPPFRASRRRQKTAGLSKCGPHSQSTDPSVATSAAV